VQVVERWVLAPLRNRRFFGLGELNAALAEKVVEVTRREFRGQPTSRRDLFLELERPALQPLPASRYEFTEIKKATANIDCRVGGGCGFGTATSARPSELPVQFSRRQLSPG
jgi:hypothetical protein